ncbi:RNA polymerase subunit sigma-24 [Anaerotruncus rubiinfantis]|uniref:RNA polymerase subunit sigma-24 n=1 Tax=Anaerotruncus rubiinfantis TaxID=1720200 RepID=UPI000831921B|nr:RNA polymerase subunit sigma-24 [Anaerotruncus rubiinfantis]
MADKKKYCIRISGNLVEVTEEVYLCYYRMKRRALHLEEKDGKHGVVYYSSMDTEGTNGEETIPDLTSPRVEDIVTDKLMSEQLHRCISQLTESDKALIDALYFQSMSERQLSVQTNIPPMTVHDRKIKVLKKLKKMMDI